MKQYKVIYADPPWQFKTYSEKGMGRSPESHYDCMSLDDIKQLPIQEYADTDCVLFLWITDPLAEKGYEVIRSWGFEPKTVGFYWVKENQHNISKENVSKNRFFMGLGYWTRSNPEQCLLATRGNPNPKAHDVRKLLITPRREHSRKPDEAYERIERLCEGPYLELFARYSRPGWDTAFSTLEGAVERRWPSTSGPSVEFDFCDDCQTKKTCKKEGVCMASVEREPIDILSFFEK